MAVTSITTGTIDASSIHLENVPSFAEQLALLNPDRYTDAPVKIAICGKMRSGKDTVAKMMLAELHAAHFKFSTGITEIIQKYFPETADTGKPREHYQKIGQSLRQLNPDVWVNYLDKQLQQCPCRNVVVSDLRQPNELKYLQEQGFIIVKVIADDAVRHDRIFQSGDQFRMQQLQDETEQGIDDMYCDYIVSNSGSLKDLKHKVSAVLDMINRAGAIE